MQATNLIPGNFTGLAENYSKYRPSYSKSVTSLLLDYVKLKREEICVADIGAGTGIWTRMLSESGVKKVQAVEPNADMRSQGEKDSESFNVSWAEGSGERTGLENSSVDLVTMASSFHWVDFDKGINEFNRILKPNGVFAALWNPRFLEANPLLVEIEETLYDMLPKLKRVSSGRSGVTETLTQKLREQPAFKDVVYIEGFHVKRLTRKEYLGVWWSVNDIRAQAGEKLFNQFMHYVEQKISGHAFIETTYQTRLWAATKRELHLTRTI